MPHLYAHHLTVLLLLPETLHIECQKPRSQHTLIKRYHLQKIVIYGK